MRPRISKGELTRRREAVLALPACGRDGALFFSPRHIFYLTNFGFLATERPIALYLNGKGRTTLFVPALEREHAEAQAEVDEVIEYPEYPSRPHPMQRLAQHLAGARVAADSDGYGSVSGYSGPRLSSLLGRDVPSIAEPLRLMMQVKSEEEIALIGVSCLWGGLAHRLLQKESRAGRSEHEISARASLDATTVMVQTLGAQYARENPFPLDAFAGFRGQIGAQSAIPHATTIHAALQPGDTLVTGASARVWGYRSELERTMFVGEPSAEQRRWFAVMLAAQDLAISLLIPGRSCADVDRELRRYAREEGVEAAVRHHVGHNIGIDGHESPFLDEGDDTELKSGMLFTVEPGFYVPGLGGFRHSDTILVTDDGPQFLTDYPRHLEDLIV